MHTQRALDDATAEAVLRGDSLPAEFEPLARAVAALRTVPEQPVQPSAELAARMAAGDFASAAAPRPSRRSAGHHVARHRATRRRLTALPLRVKVGAAVALAVGGLSSATAAGALPQPAQQHIESVIESVTPIEFPARSDFGHEVADDARDGGVDGREVSDKAKEQGRPATPASGQPATSDRTPPAEPPAVKPAAPPADTPADPSGRSNGPGKPGSPPGKPDPVPGEVRPDGPRPPG